VVEKKKATHWTNVFIGDIAFPGFGPTDQEFYTNLALHPELHGKLTELAAKRVIASEVKAKREQALTIPKGMREELINAQKEKFPQQYKGLLSDYYRALSNPNANGKEENK